MPSSLNIKSIFGAALDIADARERRAYLDRACAGNNTVRAEIDELLKAEMDAGSKHFMSNPAAESGVAGGLARDIQRHLKASGAALIEHSPPDEQPADLLPPSTRERLKAFAAKHRNAATIIVLFGMLLSITAAGLSIAARASDAKARALAAVAEREKAENAEAARRRDSEAALKLLQPLLAELLPRSRPSNTGMAADQELRANLRTYAANARERSGNFEKAIPLFEQSVEDLRRILGGEHPETLRLTCALATAYFNAGQSEKAFPLMEQTLQMQTAILGATHDDALFCMLELAFMHAESCRPAKAIKLDEFVAQQTSNTELRIRAHSDLANAFLMSGFPDKAIPAAERAIENCNAAFGPGDPRTVREIALLARACLRTGQAERSIAMCAEAVEKYRQLLGPEHPATLNVMDQLGDSYAHSNQQDKAIPLLEQTLLLQKRIAGAGHPNTVATMSNLSFAYAAAKRYEEAEHLLLNALDLQKAKFGERHHNTLSMVDALIAIYLNWDGFEQAIALATSNVANKKLAYGEFHPETLKTRHTLAQVTARAGRTANAVPLFEAQVQDSKTHLGPESPETLRAMNDFNQALAELGDPARAEQGSRELLALQIKIFGTDAEVTAPTMEQLSGALIARKKFSEAEPFLRQSLAIRQKYSPDQWQTFQVQCMLGRCLLDQQKSTEGEPLMRTGYDGLKLRTNPTSATETRVLAEMENKLVAHYFATGQAAKADALRRP